MNAKIKPNFRPSILQLILPYWLNKENWKGWILLALKIVLIFTVVYIAVWANELDGQVVDAMVKREWNGLWQVLLMALGAGVLHVIISLFSAYLIGESQQYQWRSWMTKWLIEKWTNHCAFYGIERDASVDNADQRIAQDVERFVDLTLNLTLSTLQVVVSTVSFTIVLWHLSGTLQFSAWGYDFSITGYMVYIAYLYAIGSLLISHFTGKQLITLFNDKQTVEANFRYQGMQLRENAEQVAFYDGGQRECQRLVACFEDVKGNWRAIIVRTCKMMLARDVYVQTGSILPTAAALPRYLSGAISLGDVTRITGAFGSVTSSLSFFTQAYVGFAEWKAVSNRLRDLIGAVEQNQYEAESAKISLNHSDKDEIYTSSLNLTRPNGEVISHAPEIHIRHGERWLIQGKSGAGKSTILRAIAGIWPYGQGQIFIPQHQKLMFLPQRSYIPTGTLKAALCYPNDSLHFNNDVCINMLKLVHLETLVEKLNTEDRWQQKLSGGEQQRLAFARALLQQPDFLFLDEATSAIDPETEQSLYQSVIAILPNAAIISVAHRESLTQYHDHILNLSRSEK